MKIKVTGLAIVLCIGCILVAGCDNAAKQPPPAAPNSVENKSDSTKQNLTAGELATVKETERLIYSIPLDGSQNLVATKVKVKAPAGQEGLATLQAFVKKNVNDLPAATKVLGLNIKDGIASVNFSKEFLTKGQGEYKQTMVVYGVVNTLTEFPSVKKVQFLVEGKKVEVLGQMDLATPLERNKSYLPKK